MGEKDSKPTLWQLPAAGAVVLAITTVALGGDDAISAEQWAGMVDGCLGPEVSPEYVEHEVHEAIEQFYAHADGIDMPTLEGGRINYAQVKADFEFVINYYEDVDFPYGASDLEDAAGESVEWASRHLSTHFHGTECPAVDVNPAFELEDF